MTSSQVLLTEFFRLKVQGEKLIADSQQKRLTLETVDDSQSKQSSTSDKELAASNSDVEQANRSSNMQCDDSQPSKEPVSLRKAAFGDDEPFVMDSRKRGNIGRYLNHSCEPNVFVQNVFIETHDMRFPVIAFFAFKRIKAGSELCWDYHYPVGQVEGKEIMCYCGAKNCGGRIL